MTDDHVTPETRQALDLMAATLHSTPELHDDMGLRLSWLLAQIVVDVAGIPDADDRASVLTNIHDDLVRLTEHWAAEAKRALATRMPDVRMTTAAGRVLLFSRSHQDGELVSSWLPVHPSNKGDE